MFEQSPLSTRTLRCHRVLFQLVSIVKKPAASTGSLQTSDLHTKVPLSSTGRVTKLTNLARTFLLAQAWVLGVARRLGEGTVACQPTTSDAERSQGKRKIPTLPWVRIKHFADHAGDTQSPIAEIQENRCTLMSLAMQDTMSLCRITWRSVGIPRLHIGHILTRETFGLKRVNMTNMTSTEYHVRPGRHVCGNRGSLVHVCCVRTTT